MFQLGVVGGIFQSLNCKILDFINLNLVPAMPG
jgi:hypothetical protein